MLTLVSLAARPVDPRDLTVEESEPTSRVSFGTSDALRCRTYDLTGVDAVEAVDCDD